MKQLYNVKSVSLLNTLLALQIIPTPFDTIFLMYSTWSVQRNLTSVMTFKNLKVRTLSTISPLSVTHFDDMGSFRKLKIIHLVFSTFKESLLIAIHSDNLHSSSFITSMRWSKLLPWTNTFVSSANKIVNKTEETLAISLTYKGNRSGPKIDPCGTPHDISMDSELWLENETYWLRFDK